jgi:hypothetical protein
MEEGEEADAILFMALVVSPFWCFGFVYGAAADRVRDPFFFASVSGRLALSLSLVF